MNLGYNLVNQLQLVAFPLFLNVYLVRVLNLEDLGKWYLVNSAAALVQLLITAPHFALVKKLNTTLSNPGKLIVSGIISYIVLLLGTTPFFALYIYFSAPEASFVAILVFTHLLFSTISCEYYFQARLKQKFIMFRRSITRAVLLFLLVIFIRAPSDFELFLCLIIGVYIAEHIIGLVAVARQVDLKMTDKVTLTATMKSVLEMLPFNATHNTLPHIVLLLAPRLFDLETVAILSILIRVINMVTTMVTSSVNVIFPFLASGHGDETLKQRLARLTGLVSAMLGVLCFLMNKPISWVFLNRELESEQVLGFGMLCAYILFHSIYNYIAFNFLVARSQTIRVTQSNMIVLISFSILVTILPLNFTTYLGAMSLCAGLGLVLLISYERKTRSTVK